MGEVAEVKKEDIFKRETSVSSPWMDPSFNKVESLGGEPGFKVDDIPERLGLTQQGQDTSSANFAYFSDLEDAPKTYGTKLQFLQTDGKGKLNWAWPYWSKSGSTVYYKSGKVAVGHAAPQEIFHISKGQETLASRISCKISPWQQWECLDSNYGFAWGIAADDKKFHLHYDTPMGTVSVHGLCFDALNSLVGILQDSPAYPLDVNGAARLDDLYLNDTNASHVVLFHWNEDESSANRTLNFTLNGGTRTFALHGNLTVESASLVNQDLTTDASPTFVKLNLTGAILSVETTDNFIFSDALPASLSGATDNIIIGKGAGTSLTSGDQHICLGTDAGATQTTEIRNVFIGYQAGKGTGAGHQYNVGIGYQALLDLTSGSYCMAFGAFALQNVTNGSDNVAIGYNAGGTISSGANNICIGTNSSLYKNKSDSITIGQASGAWDVGAKVVFIGKEAGKGVNGANFSESVHIGYRSGFSPASSGVAIYNTAIGTYSMYTVQSADNCVAIGYRAGYDITTGGNNTLVGREAGENISSGAGNVCLGYMAGEGQITTDSDELWIANSDTATPLIYGEFPNTLLKFNADVYIPSKDLILDKTSGKGVKVDTTTPTFGWRDLLGDQFAKNTGGTKPLLTTYNGDIDAWQFSDGDEAFLTFHIPHDYVAGTDVHLHIHWSQNNAGATGGTVDFKYFAIYAKGHNQASGSAFTGTPITASFSSIDINDGGQGLTRYQHHLTEVVISAASATDALFDRDDFEPDGVIELTLEMDTNSLTGTPSDPFIHYVDLHYQSTNIGTKDKAPDFYA